MTTRHCRELLQKLDLQQALVQSISHTQPEHGSDVFSIQIQRPGFPWPRWEPLHCTAERKNVTVANVRLCKCGVSKARA
jgi:hypothetical protein